jgi:homoserine dehydrogenase
VAKVLAEHARSLKWRAGRGVALTAISAREKNKDRGVDLSGVRFENDPLAIAEGADVDVVVELIGGEEGVARALVETALRAKKHVVTANKALLARHGASLAALAERNNVSLKFEAAICGGIPIVKALREGLIAYDISAVRGILNGTCNFILTQMEATGRPFSEVLAEAQRLGYAEADPTLDIGGGDTAHKLTLLASLAFGPTFGRPAEELVHGKREPAEARLSAYYMRFQVLDVPGVMAEISRHLANEMVSIESMIQRGRSPGEPVAIVMITHETQHVAVVRALKAIAASDKVCETPCMIPMEAA